MKNIYLLPAIILIIIFIPNGCSPDYSLATKDNSEYRLNPTSTDPDAFRDELVANEVLFAFNLLYSTNIPSTGTISVADRKTLPEVQGDPAFMPITYFAFLAKAAELFTTLNTFQYHDKFKALFDINLPSSGLSPFHRNALFEIVSVVNMQCESLYL